MGNSFINGLIVIVQVHAMGDIVRCVAGFEDSVRKFVCHVISITYQNILEETLCEQLGLVDENAVNQGLYLVLS